MVEKMPDRALDELLTSPIFSRLHLLQERNLEQEGRFQIPSSGKQRVIRCYNIGGKNGIDF